MPAPNYIDPSRPSAQRVQLAIASAANSTGVDFNYLLGQARIESGLNPAARATTSSATGLFQFTKQTWLATVKQHGADHGLDWASDAITHSADGQYRVSNPALASDIMALREQPEAASAMAAEFAGDNGNFLRDEIGREPEPVDMYLAHFLGSGGAARFLKAHDANPDMGAAPLLPKAAAANRGVFYRADGSQRSLGEIRNRFAAKLRAVGDTAPQITAHSHNVATNTNPSPRTFAPTEFPPMLSIAQMPRHLSLDFARSAYGRLAAMGGARAQ